MKITLTLDSDEAEMLDAGTKASWGQWGELYAKEKEPGTFVRRRAWLAKLAIYIVSRELIANGGPIPSPAAVDLRQETPEETSERMESWNGNKRNDSDEGKDGARFSFPC
jgi:hypothetical protein